MHPLRTFRRRLIDALLIGAFALGNLLVVLHVAFQPKNPAEGIAIVFTPWTSAANALDRATAPGSRFVRYGGYPFIVVVIPDDPGYVSRVSSRGALLVLDPKALAACFSGTAREGNSA